ncbi:MAG: lipoprotein [Parvibaculum sp.]|nr:lipoprotein [Parvibaculum sp.]
MSRIILLAGAALALAGCSTVVDGTSQTLGVNTSPAEASCVFNRNGQQIAKIDPTPGTVKIDKTKHDIIVECTKEGYQKATFINKSDVNSATFGNILIGGGIGWAIDSATGSDNKYQATVSLTLVPDDAPPAPVVEPDPNIRQDVGAALTN